MNECNKACMALNFRALRMEKKAFLFLVRSVRLLTEAEKKKLFAKNPRLVQGKALLFRQTFQILPKRLIFFQKLFVFYGELAPENEIRKSVFMKYTVAY